jgi:hypothetical protein
MTNNKTSISKLKVSLLSRQERSKEALPAAIKAFGLFFIIILSIFTTFLGKR